MTLPFYKWHGAGNDFIIIVDEHIVLNQEFVAKLCHRRFGIGADGLMVLHQHEEHAFEMCYYNSDGKLGSLCGNGSRCAVAMAAHLGWVKEDCSFLASDGVHSAKIIDNGKAYIVHLSMHDVDTIEVLDEGFFVNTGSPHWVLFREDIEKINVPVEGCEYRSNPRFITGTNVNFVEIKNDTTLAIRTYERGVENETLSCGTGVTAAAIAFAQCKNYLDGEYKIAIQAVGGEFTVTFRVEKQSFKEIQLIGPAQLVFSGEFDGNV